MKAAVLALAASLLLPSVAVADNPAATYAGQQAPADQSVVG